MGNLCGKQDPSPSDAPRPQSGVNTSGGRSRTLGGDGPPAAGGPDDARGKAGAAAVARAEAAQSKASGKLGSLSQAQRKQRRTDTLKEISDTERRRREIDAGADVLNYN